MLPGLGLRLDALTLLGLSLFLGLPDLDPAPEPAAERGWRLLRRVGPALAALAGSTAITAVGLALAVAGRVRAGPAAAGPAAAGRGAGWPDALAPLLLLPLAVAGVFDARPAPGGPVAALPWGWIALAVLAAIAGAGCWPRRWGRGLADRGSLGAALYTAASLLPLLRSLGAGPWDASARLVALAVGLALLGGAGWAALHAATPGAAGAAGRYYLAGVLLTGLGGGTPAAVGGGLLLLVAGLVGRALWPAGGTARWLGLGAGAGLPPTLGFAGLWLLLGATGAAGLPLATVAVPVAGWLVAGAGLRAHRAAHGRGGPAAGLWAAGLLLGGLLPGLLLDGILRPALNTLAAGLPALAAVQPWPGVGLLAAQGNVPTAVWPAWGVAAALLLTGAGAEAAARLGALVRRRRGSRPGA